MKGKRILALLLSVAMILTSTVMDASIVFGAEAEKSEKKGAAQQSVAQAMDVTLTGEGTEESPYQIGTEEELKAFRDLVNTNEASAIASWAELTNDIELTDTWTAISTTSTVTQTYSGTFDGKGHTVSGVNMQESSIRRGFFGTINGGTIKNLNVSGTISSTSGYVGGIVGFINAGTVENCSFDGSVTTAMSGTAYYAGGIAGGFNNDGDSISGCVNRGDITGSYAGGIIGYSRKSDTITNCYNTGAIKGSGNGKAGGIAGQLSNGAITNCFNIGEVTNADTTSGTVGGIYGYSSATITNCYYTLPEQQKNLGGSAVLAEDAKVESMEGMADTLGEAFVEGAEHPILSWEGPGVEVKKATVRFDVTPSDAVIKVGKKTVTDNMIELKAGSYTYTISADGYKTATGTFEVTEAQAEAEDTIELDAVSLIALDHITVSGYQAEYYKGDELTGLTVTAVYEDDSEEEVTGYTTDWDSSQAAENVVVTVTYGGKTTTFTTNIIARPSVLDPVDGKMDVNLKAGTYGFDEDTENGWLASNNQSKNSSSAVMTMTATQPGMFSFKYKVSSEAKWDKFSVKVNSSNTLVDAVSGDIDWTEQSVLLSVGDVVTFTYAKDSGGNNGQDTVWVKDLAMAPAYTITFNTTPANAEVVLKDSEDQTVSGENGVYTVLDGTYTYTASAFGYEDKTGTVTVNGDNVTENVELTQLPNKQVTFNITMPADHDPLLNQIVVKSGDVEIPPMTTGTYVLPAGDYTYTVKHPQCETASGSFTVEDSDLTIDVTMVHQVSILEGLEGKMNIELVSGTYGFTEDFDNKWLVTNNQGVGNSSAEMKMTALQAGVFSFKYKVGSEASYDKFTIQNGSTTIVNAVSGVKDWTEQSITLAAGDIVTFKYTKDGSGDRNDDSVWLKDFSMAPAYSVSFDVTPENADVVLKNADNETLTAKDGVYTVVDGSYTYTVSAFGYETATGTVTVDGEDVTETVALTKLPEKSVTFDVDLPEGLDPADLTYEVKSGSTVIDAVSAGQYALPAGDYTYTVAHPNCDTSTGSFTVSDEDVTVSVTMNRILVITDFFDTDIVTPSNDNSYPFTGVYDDDGNYLESQKPMQGGKTAKITLVFIQDARLDFEYWTNLATSSYGSYGMSIKKNGTTVGSVINGSHDWTEYSLDASAGDTVTIEYYRSYSDTSDSSIRLREFDLTPIYSLDFVLPDGASVKLTQDGDVIEGNNGSYLVEDGEYDYTVSKFGYEDKTGQVTIDGSAQSVEITDADLVKLDSKTITFSTVPEDAEVTVTHASAGVMTPETDGSYVLPTGETFSYTVAKTDYITKDGSFTVSDDAEIAVELSYAGEGWDGETKTQPEQGTGTAGDPYIVTNGAELAWVTEQINAGSGALCLKLDENINLNDKTWTSIGTTQTRYTGTFDGNGKTISGLNAQVGLFSQIGEGGLVKDLTVGGHVSGSMNVGGIADYCAGTIQNSVMTGLVENSNNYSTGGIVGRLQTAGKIVGCVNKAVINNTSTIYSSEINTGGIVGYSYGTVENCYNVGAVQARTDRTNTRVGGLIGKNYSSSIIRNSYNAGTVTGPEAGSYDFAGWSMGTLDNCYAIDSTGAQATTGVETRTAEEMKAEDFVIELGADTWNADTDNINNGMAILKWQGGSEVDDPNAVDVAAAKNALELKGEKNEEAVDLTKEGDTYVVKPGDVDKLLLPEDGAEDTKITWSSDNAAVNAEDGSVTKPETGKAEVTLTATIKKGHAKATKTFAVSVWSDQAVTEEQLGIMADKLEDSAVSASEIAHPEEQTLSAVILRALDGYGYDTEDLTVTLVSVEGDNAYIGEDGALTYYKGEREGMNYAIYNRSIKVKLAKDGAEKELTLKQLLISWDKEYVEELLSGFAADVTWDSIKGDRENTAEKDESGDVPVYDVDGFVDGDLKLPAQTGAASVDWTSSDEDHAEIGTMEIESGNMYYPCTLIPSADDDVTLTLEASLTYNRLNDVDKVEGASGVSAKVRFSFTIEQNDNPGIDKEEVQKAYDEHYAELIKDFVYKDQSVDISALTDDIQLPTPGDLEDNGMMPDRDNEQVEITTDNENVLRKYGHHVYVYRPLPGEEDATANITVTLKNRTNGSVIATTTVPVTVKAFTQKEIDDAAAEMQAVTTEDIYWAGLAEGTSNTREEVTENLNTYKEIWKNEDGTYQYVKGKDADFRFIALDELPGYDPMGSQKWWTLRSSNEDVITSENLLVTRPEEQNPEVTIDSVMSYVKYANYWEKFGESEDATAETKEKYAMFEQFYKVPVSVTVTVKGIHVHQMVHFPAKEATEAEEGNIEYWRCTACGKYFADEEGTTELTWEEIVIAKLPHTHKLEHFDAKEATETEDGNIEYWYCAGCGKYFADAEGTKELTKDEVIIPKKGEPEPDEETKPEKVGTKFKVKGNQYKVTSSNAKAPKVSLIKGAKKAKVSIPAAVTRKGVKYKVTAIAKKAFFKNKKVKSVTVGSNILTIGAQAFSKCTKLKKFTVGKNVKKIGAKNFSGSKKLKTLIIKSKKLKKAGIKNALKGSKIKTVKVKVGSKKVNKKFVKKYKRIFTKKICGRKVKVK